MEYIKLQSKAQDGKVLAIGHSMGGILLYAMLSKCGFEGVESGLKAVVTLASSVDYTSSSSSLKFLLPLADSLQALNVPVVPIGALLAAAYPLSSCPPYVLSWLNPQISAQDMMHPELFAKLVLNNFGTVPTKVLLQLTTAFSDRGLCNRTGTFSYKVHLHKCNVPVLALAGDQDLICPPEAVYGKYRTYRVIVKLNWLRLNFSIDEQKLPNSSLSIGSHTKYLENQMAHIMPTVIWWTGGWYHASPSPHYEWSLQGHISYVEPIGCPSFILTQAEDWDVKVGDSCSLNYINPHNRLTWLNVQHRW